MQSTAIHRRETSLYGGAWVINKPSSKQLAYITIEDEMRIGTELFGFVERGGRSLKCKFNLHLALAVISTSADLVLCHNKGQNDARIYRICSLGFSLLSDTDLLHVVHLFDVIIF